jgi:hypothetical protein
MFIHGNADTTPAGQKRSQLSRLGQTERANVGTNANSAGGPICASLTFLRERTSPGLALSAVEIVV